MSLYNLPAELLHAICEVCPNDTLQDLRFTCQKLRKVADKHFFPEVVTCIERGDLARVRNVADCNEGIRNTIKSFVVQADRFDADIDGSHVSQREWLNNRILFMTASRTQLSDLVDHLDQAHAAHHRLGHSKALARYLTQLAVQGEDKELLKLAYRTYQDLADDERRLLGNDRNDRETSTVRNTFDKLFEACPNISAITVNHKHTLRRNAGLSNLAFLNSTTIPHGGNSFVEEVVEQLLPAACDANLKISDLAIAGASPYWMCPTLVTLPGKRPSPRAKFIPRYYEVLQHVQRLHLVFNGADAQADDYDPDVIGGLSFVMDTFANRVLIDWLKHCPLVQELRLVLPVAPYVNWRVDMKDIMVQVHLSNLTVLHVSNFQAKADEIVQCLLQHKDTLQELELATVHLSSGDWPSCLSGFAGKLPHLRSAKLNGLFTSDDAEDEERTICFLTIPQAKEHQAELEKYILDGKGPIPTWPTVHLSDGADEDDEEFLDDLEDGVGDDNDDGDTDREGDTALDAPNEDAGHEEGLGDFFDSDDSDVPEEGTIGDRFVYEESDDADEDQTMHNS